MGINLPKLDNLGYKELRSAAQAKLPKSAPAWDDHNLSDPGITFLEFFSWLSDVELYRLNRVTPAHLKKFLALLGDRYPSAKAASGIIVRNDEVDASVRINAGHKIEVAAQGKKKVFQSLRTFYGNPTKITSITVLGSSDEYTTRSFDEHQNIEPFYAFGATPKNKNLFRLNLHTMLSKRLKLYIDLETSDLPSFEEGWEEDYKWLQSNDSVELEWRLIVGDQAYLIIPRQDCTFNLRYSGMVSFILSEAIVPFETDESLAIECRLKRGSYMIAPFIKGIYLNTIELEQAETITQNIDSTGEASQQLIIDLKHVLDSNGQGMAIETKNSNEAIVPWQRVDSLHDSKGSDNHFVYDNITQQISFGDGEHGSVVPHGEQIISHYRVSEGAEGNMPLKPRWKVAGLCFYNPMHIEGGSDLPDFNDRFAAITAKQRQPSQGVTLADYEALAKATPGLRVARAKITADSIENRISVTVVPYSRSPYPMPDDFFCARVCRFLDTRRLITTRISVEKPHYTRVGADVRIKAHVSFDEDAIELRIIQAIDDYLHPLYGGDDKQGWSFGRAVYLSDIYALLEPIEGVDCVLSVAFNGEGNYDGIKKAYVIAPESLIRMTMHQVTFVQSSIACGGET